MKQPEQFFKVNDESDEIPRSVTNHKFTHAAVAVIVCWIQDAVVLLESMGDHSAITLSNPPFIYLNDAEIAKEWEDIKKRVKDGMKHNNFDVPDTRVVVDRHALLSNITENMRMTREGLIQDNAQTRQLVSNGTNEVLNRLDPLLNCMNTSLHQQHEEKEAVMRLYAKQIGFELNTINHDVLGPPNRNTSTNRVTDIASQPKDGQSSGISALSNYEKELEVQESIKISEYVKQNEDSWIIDLVTYWMNRESICMSCWLPTANMNKKDMHRQKKIYSKCKEASDDN